MKSLGEFAAVPASPALRVRWVEYPFCARSRQDAAGCRCPVCEGKPRPLWWESVIHDGEPMWSTEPGVPCFRESAASRQRWVHDGAVVAFRAGALLIAADDGRVLTLNTDRVRSLA